MIVPKNFKVKYAMKDLHLGIKVAKDPMCNLGA